MPNGYSPENIQISLNGTVLATARKINLGVERESEDIKVLGRSTPYDTVMRSKTYPDAELILVPSEAHALMREAGPGKDITDLGEVTLVIQSLDENAVLTTRRAFGRFKSFNEEFDADNDFKELSIGIHIREAEYNV